MAAKPAPARRAGFPTTAAAAPAAAASQRRAPARAAAGGAATAPAAATTTTRTTTRRTTTRRPAPRPAARRAAAQPAAGTPAGTGGAAAGGPPAGQAAAGTPAAAATVARPPANPNSPKVKTWVWVLLVLAVLFLGGAAVKYGPSIWKKVSSGNPAVGSGNSGAAGLTGNSMSVTTMGEEVLRHNFQVLSTNRFFTNEVTKQVYIPGPNGSGFIFAPVMINGNGNVGGNNGTLPACTTNPPTGTNGHPTTFTAPQTAMSAEVAMLAGQGKLRTYEADAHGKLPECIEVPTGTAAVILMPVPTNGTAMQLATQPLNNRRVVYYYDDMDEATAERIVAGGEKLRFSRLYAVNRETSRITPARLLCQWSATPAGSNTGGLAMN